MTEAIGMAENMAFRSPRSGGVEQSEAPSPLAGLADGLRTGTVEPDVTEANPIGALFREPKLTEAKSVPQKEQPALSEEDDGEPEAIVRRDTTDEDKTASADEESEDLIGGSQPRIGHGGTIASGSGRV